jgi:glycosyltransferase involved in cell wall biosynthesis
MNKFNLSAAEIEQRSRPRLALVVPCYNEEGVLQTTIAELNRRLDALIADASCASDSYIVFVDDGSKDETWPIIAAAVAAAPARVVGVRLARNSGHQYALMAGLAYVTDRSDASISIDADLQDDLDVLQEMVARYRDGAELVLGIRRSRATDSWFKRTSAAAFYKLLGLLGVDIVEQHADFRLLSAAAMGNLRQFPEYHLFLRGFPNLLHNRVDYVHYDRHARTAGQSKYPIARMLALALDGITSFSVVPLRLISILGFLVFFVATLLVIFALVARGVGEALPGWASITVPLYAMGGMIMLSVGIVGEYVGKTYTEVKRRPRYLVDHVEGGVD